MVSPASHFTCGILLVHLAANMQQISFRTEDWGANLERTLVQAQKCNDMEVLRQTLRLGEGETAGQTCTKALYNCPCKGRF